MHDGANPKYCAGCRAGFEARGRSTPCRRCKVDYPERPSPGLLPANQECSEVYQLCFLCRDGFGALDYRFVGTVLDKFGFDDDTWIENLQKIQRVESALKEQKGKGKSGNV